MHALGLDRNAGSRFSDEAGTHPDSSEPRCALMDEAAPPRFVDRFGLGMHLELAVNAFEVAVHRRGADAANLRRFGVRKSLRDHFQDLVLARGQTRFAAGSGF